MALPSAILMRDTRASQPAASLVAAGTLYCVSDESNIVEQSTGSAWVAYSPSAAGGGDVTGPGSSVDGEIVLFDGTSGTLIKRATGTGFVKAASGVYSAGAITRTIGITIDGGGSAITTGVKGYLPACPFAGTITAATLIADQTGSIVIDVWKDTYANAPPDNSDSITASAPPTLSSAQKSQDSTLTGWTTSVSSGDVFGFNVDSATTVTRVTLVLSVSVTS